MKIVEAFWEKRNLGVSCKEIVLEQSDSVVDLDVLATLSLSTEYLVVKVPTTRFDINVSLSSLGFAFVEGSVNVVLQLKDAILSPLQQRLNAAIAYSEMSVEDIECLNVELQNGLYATDRVLLDSHFTPEQAAHRYVNWIDDELKRTSQVYKITYKNDTIGFFTFKMMSDGVCYPFLGGLYQNFASSGLGFATLRKPIEEAISRGCRMISTYVSTNNPAVLRAHMQQGFSIREMQYVFVKHNIIN